MKSITMQPIAHIRTPFPTKFGIPRQSGLVEGLRGLIVFEPPYRNVEALRGLEDFSHLWLIWDFSEAHRDGWSPTVRPPRLGGNRRLGVWATRSPFRPNPIGLSSVRITAIRLHTPDGPVIEVEGADLMDGSPILDIKPYLPYTDSHPEALSGFARAPQDEGERTEVVIPSGLCRLMDGETLQALRGILAADPRPRYHDRPERLYTFPFAGFVVTFRACEGHILVTGLERSVANPD